MRPPDADAAVAHLLFEPLVAQSIAWRLALVTEEIRVARLIAHMRPYLISATRPSVSIPAPRSPKEERRAAVRPVRPGGPGRRPR